MCRQLVVLLLALASSIIAEQDSSSSVPVAVTSSNVKLAYNSSLIYPGCKVGIELPVRTVEVTRFRKFAPPRLTLKTRFIAATLNWYHHPTFHDNVYLTVEWLMRRTSASGLVGEFVSGLGYSRTFLSGTTYVVDESGSVSVERIKGYNYALATVGWGIGYDLSAKKTLPLSIICRLSVIAMYPYNSTVYPRPTLDLGVVYKPTHFLQAKMRIATKTWGRK